MLFVGCRCALFLVCCVLFLPFAVDWLLSGGRSVLFVGRNCSSLCVVRCWFFGGCCLLLVVCCSLMCVPCSVRRLLLLVGLGCLLFAVCCCVLYFSYLIFRRLFGVCSLLLCAEWCLLFVAW